MTTLKTNGLIKAYCVDDSPCSCEGTPYQDTGINVVPVRWKLTGKNPCGKVRFQCNRCKHRWTMTNVPWVLTETEDRRGTCSGRVSCA